MFFYINSKSNSMVIYVLKSMFIGLYLHFVINSQIKLLFSHDKKEINKNIS